MARSSPKSKTAAKKEPAVEAPAVEPDPAPEEPTDTEQPPAEPVADMIATVSGDLPIPVGTPVVARDGQIGRVLSYDETTRQVQIELDNGGRGWYAPRDFSLQD